MNHRIPDPNHVAPQVSWLTKWLTTFWASGVLHSTVGEYVRFQSASHTKWFVTLDTFVCSFFAVSYCAPPQISCLMEWLMTFWTLVHLASTIGERISLHFDFVCSDQENSTPRRLTNYKAVYFRNFFKFFERHFIQRLFRLLLFTFLRFLLQLFWTPQFMAT